MMNINDLIQKVNETQRAFPQGKTIHQLFEDQVAKTPGNIAVVFEDKQLTYKELNEKSNQLARYITAKYKSTTNQELQPDTPIALYLDRSLEMIISILAVLKTGAAYVPISPDFPSDRTKYILEDTNSTILLSQAHLTDKLSEVAQDIEIIATDLQEFQNYSKDNLSTNVQPNNLAYIIYTSGTTGKPKGVALEHKGIINRVVWMQSIYPLTNKDRILQKTPYNFDVSIWELLWANWYGAAIVIAKPEGHKDCDYLYQLINKEKITVIHFVPSMLDVFLNYLSTKESSQSNLQIVFCSGEALKNNTCDTFYKLIPNISLYNLYGPTEASIDVSYSLCEPDKKVTIGKPISNTKLYILDNNLLPTPIGVPGELYIGGAGLARGYLNLLQLTKEKFINNPFATPDDIAKGYTRLYKTGDICKWLANGEIEYIDRNDFQVKLRGFRIELGEIENVISAINNIKQSCVLVNNETLVAYYVADTEIDESVIKNHLAKKLPEYMIPSFYMRLESFPLTINGKLDRRALPNFNISNIKQQYLAPTTELQQKMCQIWQEVLKIDKVGVTDNFFNIGGNSILAITTIMKINQITNKRYQVIDLLKSQTIQQLSNLEVNSNNISNERLNLSSGKLHHFEKAIFSHQLSSGHNLIYNESFLIDYKKHIDLNNLKSGVKYLLDKYTLLHSNYIYNNDGCLKRILNYDNSCICKQKIVKTQTELHQVLNEIERISFDLYTDKLIRFYLIDVLDIKKKYLFISCHHLILDATSLINIILPDLYSYLFLNEKDSRKSDINDFNEASYYINKQYKNNFEEKLNFWKNKLESLSPLDLPKNNQEFTNKGKQISFNCDKKTRTQLLQVSKNLNTSEFSILYTLFILVLHKISNQTKFAIITNIDERLYTPKHKDTIGCLINNMFLASDFDSNNNLIYFIHQAGSEIISNINNAIAYESLLDNLDREHIRLISDIQFNFETEETHNLPYNQTQIYSHSGYVKQGLYFEVDLKNGEILCRVEFNNQYEKDFIYTVINGYKTLLFKLDIILNKKISEISIIDDDQYKKILAISSGGYQKYPQKTIHQLFEDQVAKTPGNIAVVFEDKQLTYKELNEKSNQLARYITAKYKSTTNQELQPDTPIALYLDRSLEMIISILAVLKTGAAYVPISPDFPSDRTKYILEDTNSTILLSQAHLTDKLSEVAQDIEIIATDLQEFQNYSKDNLSTNVQPNNLAYIIYTSGTTGKPKGVALEHKGIINRVVWMQSIYPLTNKDRILQKTPYNFDVSIWELLWANWYGAAIVIAKPEGHKDCDYLYQLINKEKITVIHFVPSMLDVFLNYLSTKESSQSNLQIVFCSGEALKNNTCDTFYKLIPNISLYNLYGPTEASIDVSYSLCEPDKKVTIGKPISNTKLYILDNNLLPTPIGVPGELYIGGAGLARGYLNLLQLTKEKFINNPFATPDDIAKGYTRLYKTGDICKWLANGEIEYIDRNDFQVKLRGFRIELGEIENVISAINNIKQSCVLVNNETLVAYYVADTEIDESVIKNHLAKKLPEYMIPSFYMRLESFPLTINGKLDRRALPNFNISNIKQQYLAPTTELQQKMCQIWQEVLKIDKVGVTDNFFNIGGNSILSIQAAYKMTQIFDTEISIADIFRYKTIQSLLNNVSNNEFQLIKYYSNNISNKPKMIFIHPAFGGCEMYQDFIDRLSNDYNCIGIDNYNIYNEDKIDNLSKLSSFYINQLNLSKNETVYMFGWSLGGVIAIEMSYQLERQGFKNIKAIILDSHFSTGRVFEHHPQFDPNKGGKIIDEVIKKIVANFDQKHINRVLSAKDTEFKLGQSTPTGRLKHTEICFFRAMDNPGYKIKDNNLSKYSKNFGFIPITGDHMQLMPQIIKNWHNYQRSFTNFDFSLHYQPIQMRKNAILRLINTYKKVTLSICTTIIVSSAYILEVFDFVIEPVVLA